MSPTPDKSSEASSSSHEASSSSGAQYDPISIALYNQKGGIGKTTATFNFGYILSEVFKKRVLMVDADPQMSLTCLVHGDSWEDSAVQEEYYSKCEQERAKGSYITLADIFSPTMSHDDARVTETDRAEHIVLTKVQDEYKNLFIIPGNLDIGELEQPASTGIEGVRFYKGVPPSFVKVIKAFAKKNKIDIILFDLGPSVGGWNQSIIMYSDYFCVPYLPDFLSKKGMDNFLLKATRSWSETFSTKLKLESMPKFLGAFPQRSLVRKSKPKKGLSQSDKADRHSTRKPVQSFKTWILKAHQSIESKLADLQAKGFLGENFKYKLSLGIPEFHSLALDVQPSGRPISDTGYQHLHVVHESGSARSLKPQERARKAVYHIAFKKVVAQFLLNMSTAHQNQLGVETMKEAGLASLLSDDIPVPPELLELRDSRGIDIGSQDYYSNDHVKALLEHYVVNEDAVILAPMQGDQAFADRGQLRQTLSDRLQLFLKSDNDYVAYYIPFNLGHNHWVLAIMEVRVDSHKVAVLYFDPMGEGISDELDTILSQVASDNAFDYESSSHGDQLQYDGFNCGTWIIEYGRAVASNPEHPHPFPPANINACRHDHLQQLDALGVDRPGASSSPAPRPASNSRSKHPRATRASQRTSIDRLGVFGAASAADHARANKRTTADPVEGHRDKRSR